MRKAFTLLEMIVVVAIIMILFLLSVPSVVKVLDSVDQKACKTMLKVVDSAIIQYRLDYDEYPGSVRDLVSGGYLSIEQTTCSNGSSIYISNGAATVD
ncbi:MAG: prepilin-type N-terminal cleavage/methylation domain-containing protein [Erysipelotrichaceae bacterium]|nr:prepilin-type N-terminal cleavage/methylation domain-containing protein [Erysipelotrichaceae bacterium]